MKRIYISTFILLFLFIFPLLGQNIKKDLAKINTEGFQHSQVLQIITDLTDLYGPRLTGTRQYFQAAQWAKRSPCPCNQKSEQV